MLAAAKTPPMRIHNLPGRPQLQSGERVLGVLLVAPIGSGNVARVWSGLDGEEPVAVKIFDPSLRGDGSARAAFTRGAAAMTRLVAAGGAATSDDCPRSIVRLRRRSPDGSVLITDIAENNASDLPALAWPPHKIVRFFGQLCRAMEFAHRAGVVHRCLKPSNILVNDDLEPLIGDFDLVDLPSLARDDAHAGGYAAYAAPEELAGRSSNAPTADIFSLGRVLYFLLQSGEPDEPVVDLPALYPLAGQPQGLVRIIRKCTRRDPMLRYQSVRELLADLERYERVEGVGDAGPVLEAPPPSQRRTDPEEAPGSVRGGPASVRGGPTSVRGGPASARRALSLPPEDSGPVSVRAPASGRSAPPSGRGLAPAEAEEEAPLSQRAPASFRRAEPAPLSRRPTPGAAVAPSAAVVTAPASVPWLSRGAERAAAAAGGAAMLALGVAVALSALPSAGLLGAARIGAAAGAALLTLALPRFERRLVAARLAFAALAAVLVYLADPAGLAALRLRATLSSADPAARAEAVRRLAREGHRSFAGRDLSELDLAGAELSSVDFRGASLARADLAGASLMEAAFEGADLTDANARGADLSGSSAPAAEGWSSVQCDAETHLPEGFACVNGRPAAAPGDSGGAE